MAFTKEEREIIRMGRDFQDLVSHPAFKLLSELVQRRIQSETNQLIQPAMPGGVDGATITKMEDRQKGAIFGMLLTIGIPSNTIEQARQLALREAGADADETPAQDAPHVPHAAP